MGRCRIVSYRIVSSHQIQMTKCLLSAVCLAVESSSHFNFELQSKIGSWVSSLNSAIQSCCRETPDVLDGGADFHSNYEMARWKIERRRRLRRRRCVADEIKNAEPETQTMKIVLYQNYLNRIRYTGYSYTTPSCLRR